MILKIDFGKWTSIMRYLKKKKKKKRRRRKRTNKMRVRDKNSIRNG
jgi:hypothetical protein